MNDENKAKKKKEYMGIPPKCDNCPFHHAGPCRDGRSNVCDKVGHVKETCQNGTGHGNEGQDGDGNHEGNNGNNDYRRANDEQKHIRGCFDYGDKGHFKKDCPNNKQANDKIYLGTKPKCEKCKFHHDG
ncbi:ATP-dependent RNA helicase glh-2-like [Helianthus annuus]|uniref:ATP-dependent RNA helicase glh-2-like n=1 Tax=Helianthus annuus TaxID=4232 RepID=UPI000B8F588F|nr:ATP-dependent RNA helicase glh-2-like [Helianthus annuus]